MNSKRILLVEDDPLAVELTLAAMEAEHLAGEVVVVHDGEEALDYLRGSGKHAGRAGAPPAVILLDLKMPKVDGLEVLRALKSDPRLRLVPCVVLTSAAEVVDRRSCYESGANAYVVKPLEFSEFAAAMGALVRFWTVWNQPAPGGGEPGETGRSGGADGGSP